MKDDNKPKLFIYILLTVVFVVLIASCGGGGGGGGGMVAFAPDNNMPNNGGDAGGWGTGTDTGGGGIGGSSVQEDNATLLIGQVAALDVTNVNIVLFVNGERFEINNVNETTTTSVLPKISISDTVSGTAYIYVDGESSPREAQLDTTTIGFHNTLKFKVPYRYECIDRGTSARQGTYFYADGIDLTDLTGARVAGWLDSNGEMHYGGYINGVRGDITLMAVYKVAVTSNVTEISKASALITSLGITQDTAGTPVKPATAQLSVYGSENYSYSSDAPSKIDISSSGVVSLAAGYTPPLAGETVTITATDNDDSTLFATVDITISSQCVLAMYKDKASHDTGTSPDYTKFFGGSDGAASSGSLYALAGSLIEANKGAQTGNIEQISDWQKTTPSSAKLSKTADIIVDGDTKVYALYSMAVTIDNGRSAEKNKISKHSTLLAQLVSQNKIGTQDSAGTTVYPIEAQLTVTGSDGYTFSYDTSRLTINSSTGKVSVASSYTPSAAFESPITIRATDNNDSSIYAECTVQICYQQVLAVYEDKAACDNNNAPGYTILLGGYATATGTIGFCPYSQCLSVIQALKPGKTISAWKQASPTTSTIIKNEAGADGIIAVVGDTKIYAGWPIDGISTTEIVLWRFTDSANDRKATLVRPSSNSYSVSWIPSTCPIGHSIVDTSNVEFSVTNNADLTALADATDPGVYKATYRVKLQSDPASFTDVPVTVKDAMYVAEEKDADGNVIGGELRFAAGQTIPANLTITPTLVPGYTITKIANSAFKDNSTITSVTINGAISIGGSAFQGCSSLSTVSITGATGFGGNIFNHTTLTSITLTNLATTEINGFDWINTCSAVVTIPFGITKISGFTAAKVSKVIIPTSVTIINYWTFDEASCVIDFQGTVAQWKAIDKRRATYEGTNTINPSDDYNLGTVHCSDGDCQYWDGKVNGVTP